MPLDALPGTETVDWLPLHPRFARRLQVGAVIRSVAYVAAAVASQMAISPRNRAAISEFLPRLPPLLWTALGAFEACALRDYILYRVESSRRRWH